MEVEGVVSVPFKTGKKIPVFKPVLPKIQTPLYKMFTCSTFHNISAIKFTDHKLNLRTLIFHPWCYIELTPDCGLAVYIHTCPRYLVIQKYQTMI